MRWYISSRGQTWGPYEESQTVEMLRRGIPEVYLSWSYEVPGLEGTKINIGPMIDLARQRCAL